MSETRRGFIDGDRALILATPSQLRCINIEDTHITHMTCNLSDIDKMSNSIGKCSLCTIRSCDGRVDQYWINTEWLRFLKT